MFRPLALAVLLIGCKGDKDGDGLTNKEEKALGTDLENADSDSDGLSDADELAALADPLNADSDGDGLSDGDEVNVHGSDPNALDTDEDTYLDFDEVVEDSDPADPEDRIYKGYWPYNPNKDDMDIVAFPGRGAVIGEPFGTMTEGKDQFRQKVDLRDFAGHGRYIVIDGSATWCVPCMNTAAWLSSGPENDVYGYEADYKKMRLAVNQGDLTWITFITDNDSYAGQTGGTIEHSDVTFWDSSFPNEMIPVIADVEQSVLYSVNPEFFPAFVVLDPDLNVAFVGGANEVFPFVMEIL